MRRFATRKGLRSVPVTFAILAVLCLFGVRSEAKTNGWEELFFKANQAYKGGRFEEAIDGYGQLLDAGYRNGQLYYNLGNAHFRLNQVGRAILNYERA